MITHPKNHDEGSLKALNEYITLKIERVTRSQELRKDDGTTLPTFHKRSECLWRPNTCFVQSSYHASQLSRHLSECNVPSRLTKVSKTADPGEGQTFHLSSRSMKHRCSVRMYKVTPKMHPFLPANCYLILQHNRAYKLSLLSRTSIPSLIQAGLVRVKQRHLPSSTTHV